MSARHITLLAALSAIWGGSYLLIKYALEDLSAPMVVWTRVVIAAVVLYALIRVTMGASAMRGVGNELRDRPRAESAAAPLVQALGTLSCFGRRQGYFRGEFFASLQRMLRDQGTGAGYVQQILNIPLADAAAIHSVLTR